MQWSAKLEDLSLFDTITLKHIICELPSQVCKRVENEPTLQPVTEETLKYQNAKTLNSKEIDVNAVGFRCRDQRTFFDIIVFDPVVPSHAHQSLHAAFSKQENESADSMKMEYYTWNTHPSLL